MRQQCDDTPLEFLSPSLFALQKKKKNRKEKKKIQFTRVFWLYFQNVGEMGDTAANRLPIYPPNTSAKRARTIAHPLSDSPLWTSTNGASRASNIRRDKTVSFPSQSIFARPTHSRLWMRGVNETRGRRLSLHHRARQPPRCRSILLPLFPLFLFLFSLSFSVPHTTTYTSWPDYTSTLLLLLHTALPFLFLLAFSFFFLFL